jgi:gamma-glutamylcyclotransferase (GGCT)/AIG2-like uncharacterized protein YtfP
MELYFAYGSNLNMEQMKKRCPDSLPFGRAILYNHQLVFKANPRGRGVADVVPVKGKRVHGAVYEVSKEDLKKLDRFEGTPTVYKRQKIQVETSKGVVNAWVYLMMPHYELKKPLLEYYMKIHVGYDNWYLPTEKLKKCFDEFKVLLKKSSQNKKQQEKAVVNQ